MQSCLIIAVISLRGAFVCLKFRVCIESLVFWGCKAGQDDIAVSISMYGLLRRLVSCCESL